jgi:hypothetical protein
MAGAVLLLRPAFPPGAAGCVLPWSAGERPRYFEEDPQDPAVGSPKEPRRRSTAACDARVIAHCLERLVAARTRQTNR